jgi:hypothetical protein
MGATKISTYVIRRRDDGCEFVPSSMLAALMVAGFSVGAAVFLSMSIYFFQHPQMLYGPILLLAGGMVGAMAIRAWRTRATPLKVENGGRVSYGEHELCALGTVRCVRIVASIGGEVGDCDVQLEQVDGRLISIPSQYFARFRSYAHARPFAAEFAKALRVEVTESR